MILQEHSTFTQRVYPAGAPVPSDAELCLGHMGRLESKGGFQWEQLAEGASLHVVQEGKGRVWCDGVAHEANAGDLFVFREGHTYRYGDMPSEPWSYTHFSFLGSKADACMELLGFTAARPVRSIPFSSPFWMRLQNMTAEFAQGTMAGVSPVRAAWAMVESLSYQTDRPFVPKGSALAETARKLIESTPQSITNVNDLAVALHVSRTTLFRSFKERYEISIKEFMEQVRFTRIEPLLKNPEFSISDVARIAGFNDPLYFSRAFSKRYGMPPAEWRRREG